MRRQPATIICDATRWRAPRRRPRAIGTTCQAITATTAVRPSMAASASSRTVAARAPSISAVFDPPPIAARSHQAQQSLPNKKARRDGSRRAPIVARWSRAESAPMPDPKTQGLAGDPSEVTALGIRHWITSFHC